MARDELPTIDDVLGPQGLLSERFENYEHRTQQVRMAKAVENAISKERQLVVEAATGTGKTLAYLIPALRSGKCVVVSTGTKALQEQLFEKDIPLLRDLWPEPFEAELLKGRRNYLCKDRFEEMLYNPKFRGPTDSRHWPDIHAWALKTETGDRAEIPGLPDDYATWADLSISSDACKGSKCKHYESCYVTQARRRTQEARIIVVNHHLFFADLALRQTGFAEILPEFDVVIFDEAHHLENIASAYFGKEASNFRISELIGDIRNAMKEAALTDQEVEDAIRAVSTYGTSFFTLLAFGLYSDRYPLKHVLEGGQKVKIEDTHQQLVSNLTALERRLSFFGDSTEISERLKERAATLKHDLEWLLRCDDERYTYILDIRDRGVFMQAAPIDLAELFRTKLLEKHDSIVFTSATMTTGQDFSYFKKRMGMMPLSRKDDKRSKWDVDELMLDPVFDYDEKCVVYIPQRLPPPNDPKFLDGVCQIIEYLVGITDGHAFVLFTSRANMNAAYDALWEKLDCNLLKQGEAPKAELIAEFREEKGSVLFATSSFWEGVDVPGDALQLVIIDKLPFASPSDPLIRARIDLLEARGGNSFMDYSVPQAALMLKQGFGRLIRTASDTGIVAILDSRIAHKRYGKIFLDTLPPAPVVWNASGVKRWWNERFET